MNSFPAAIGQCRDFPAACLPLKLLSHAAVANLSSSVTTYSGADKSLVRPTSRCISFDGENISFDASLVIYIKRTNISQTMILHSIYENQNLLSLQLVSFLDGVRTYQHPCIIRQKLCATFAFYSLKQLEVNLLPCFLHIIGVEDILAYCHYNLKLMPQLLSHVFRLTVQKDSPNRECQFYACSKPQHERCNFFKWADDINPGDDGRWAGAPWGSTSGGRGAGRMLSVLRRNSRSV